MMTSFKRIFINGAKSFARSGSVSFATVLIMTVTLLIIGLLMFLSAVLDHTLSAIRDKVDVNVYFVTTAAETDIVAFQRQLAEIPEVERVTYTSRDEALQAFRERHAGDELTLQALEELGENPLGASLAIKANDPSQYAAIVNFISNNPATGPDGASLIERVNYFQNKDVIDRLTAAMNATEQAGLVIVLLFALASATIAYATVRLAIYTSRDEIGVMRLMGASNMFIRGPFVVAGVLSGALAGLIVLLLFYPFAFTVGGALRTWLGGFDIFAYYTGNFALFFIVLLGTGIVLGGLASWFAVRKYLKV
ncbi:MAG TPA: permease-like cell division protein FtsX [Candidatus Paceibacterota bacterium]|nr:permease-like cell division protein FtsX [Candidatus Paceibacterota bacterium]